MTLMQKSPVILSAAKDLCAPHQTCYGLMQKSQRLLYEGCYSIQELRPSRAIYDTVVTREREHHHRLNCWLTIDRHNTFSYATYGQDSSLRRIDDGIERIDMVHTQVADGESTAAYILRSEFPGLRFCHQFHTLLGNLPQVEFVRPVDNRNNQSLLGGYGQPYMYFLLESYFALAPRRVETG